MQQTIAFPVFLIGILLVAGVVALLVGVVIALAKACRSGFRVVAALGLALLVALTIAPVLFWSVRVDRSTESAVQIGPVHYQRWSNHQRAIPVPPIPNVEPEAPHHPNWNSRHPGLVDSNGTWSESADRRYLADQYSSVEDASRALARYASRLIEQLWRESGQPSLRLDMDSDRDQFPAISELFASELTRQLAESGVEDIALEWTAERSTESTSGTQALHALSTSRIIYTTARTDDQDADSHAEANADNPSSVDGDADAESTADGETNGEATNVAADQQSQDIASEVEDDVVHGDDAQPEAQNGEQRDDDSNGHSGGPTDADSEDDRQTGSVEEDTTGVDAPSDGQDATQPHPDGRSEQPSSGDLHSERDAAQLPLRLGLSVRNAQKVRPAPWDVNEEQTSGELTLSIDTDAAITSLPVLRTVGFVEKPWVRNESTFLTAHPGQDLLVVRTNKFALSYEEANAMVEALAGSVLAERLERMGARRNLHYPLPPAEALGSLPGFRVDRFVQQLEGPAGQPLWRAALLVDLNQMKLEPIVTDLARQTEVQRARTIQRRSVQTHHSLVVLLAVGLIYMGVNAATKGYFTGRLRLMSIVALIVGLVWIMLIS